MIIKEIYFGTAEYNKSVRLRDKILRKPLGLIFTEDDLAQDKNHFHIAVYDANKLVAVLILQPLNNKDLKMRQVAVDDNYQRKGVGSLLVEFSEKFAIEKGFSALELNARDISIPFYEKLNYNIVGEEFYEVGIAHKKMIKNL